MDGPGDLLTAVRASTARFVASAEALADDELRDRSALPGWTRAHVVAHVAANARAYERLLTWARTGIPVDQYPTQDFRDREIEQGAHAPRDTLLLDLRTSVDRFDALAIALTPEQWRAEVRASGDWWHPAWYTMVRRWREVEVHHVDLRAGYGPEEWPAEYLAAELVETLVGWRAEHPPVGVVRTTDPSVTVRVGVGPDITGPACDVLAWLAGRSGAGAVVVPEGVPHPSWPPAMVRTSLHRRPGSET